MASLKTGGGLSKNQYKHLFQTRAFLLGIIFLRIPFFRGYITILLDCH